ncbi:MAG: sulfotransferase domain-containing protein [Pseudomonadota bacterium]
MENTPPRLYLCYGMPKSGSTLAFQLTCAAARRSGFDQSPLVGESNDFGAREPEVFADLLRAARERDRRLVVVKTHAPPPDDIVAEIERGDVRAQAICRDPRDVALSMLDASHRGDAWGKAGPGHRIAIPDDARPRLRRHVNRYLRWAALPNVLRLDYEHVAFKGAQAAGSIAGHLGVRPAALRDIWAANRHFTQFNQGLRSRYETELSGADAADWYAEFREFIDEHCPKISHRNDLATFAARMARFMRSSKRAMR